MQYHPPSHPLSHHEILGLAAPFARRGLHVDLAASQRLERRLAFKEVPGPDGLREGLRLENPAEGRYLLTRTLTRPDGLQVELQTAGTDPAVLLARLDTVPPASQWHTGPGFVLAIGLRVEPQGGAASADAPLRSLATRLELHCDALVLRLQVPATPGIPADLEVEAPQGDVHELPEDLLAVLGQGWSSLWRVGAGWRGALGRGGAPLDPAAGDRLADRPGRWHARQPDEHPAGVDRRRQGRADRAVRRPGAAPPRHHAVGPRGVGKSSVVRQVAAHFGVPLVDLRLTTIEPVDIRGAIYADEAGQDGVVPAGVPARPDQPPASCSSTN
jgi:hypothetical protein